MLHTPARSAGKPKHPVSSLTALLLLCVLSGCRESQPSPTPPAPFLDVAALHGLDFRHFNGMSGALYMVEMTGAGCALFDYDNDGDLDVFFVQGQMLGPGKTPDDASAPPRHRLFRNDLALNTDGSRTLRFSDVSEAAGLTFSDYGMGAIAGDYDQDGWLDLFVTGFGGNRLLRNQGNGTFCDLTEAAGLKSEGWSSSAAWVDYDRDDRLDLFVCNYLEWTFANHHDCKHVSGRREYCSPKSYRPAQSRLYRNLGHGKFEDVSLRATISTREGAALGVVCADLNEDGWPDILVANDGMANHLWINRRDGTFAEEAQRRGCALNCDGAAEANMGVILADFGNVGRDDLYITHLKGERGTLWRNRGQGQFMDMTPHSGLDAPSRPFTGFGTGALDYDNDGHLDIFCANGEVRAVDAQLALGYQPPLRQRCTLFRNRGETRLRFEEVRHGDALALEDVGRGAAFGDIDNDGDVDIVVTNNNGPARLLLNQVGQQQHWVGLRVVMEEAGVRRDALGAVITVERQGYPPLRRRCATDGSYCSSSDPRVHFGLGEATSIERVTVRWQDGREETWTGLTVDRYHVLIHGKGGQE